jgi:hypothetical protein
MVENNSSGVVLKYYTLLKSSGIVSDDDSILIDPFEEDFKDKEYIVLQQGQAEWNLSNKKIKHIITPNVSIFEKLSKKFEIYLIEFPIDTSIYSKTTDWNKREDAIYYHGRIIPQKLPIDELKHISDQGIKIVLQGPICKAYWIDEELNDSYYVDYKNKLMKLDIEILDQAKDEKELAENLNKYKFYFTLSNGEAFNVALQEAISCGTIPLVKQSGAYWWSDKRHFPVQSVDDFIKKYKSIKDLDLENYSKHIAEDALENFSFDASYEKFKAGFWHKLWKNSPEIDFEIQSLVKNYSQHVETVMSCSGHYDGVGAFIAWKGWDDDFNNKVKSRFNGLRFRWFLNKIEEDGTFTKLTVADPGRNYHLFGEEHYYTDVVNPNEIKQHLAYDFKKLMI